MQSSHETTRNSDRRRVEHPNDPQRHEHPIGDLLPRRDSDGLVVQEGRVDVDERDAGNAPDEGDEAVEVGAAADADGAADDDEGGAEGVLLPLGQQVLLAAAVAEDAALEDTHGREQLHRVADQHGQRVQELHCVDEPRVLREIVDDLNLRTVAEGRVAQRPDRREDARDDEHHQPQQRLELLRVTHRRVDGNDEPDALERENGGADGQGVGLGIEQLDGGAHTIGGQVADVVLPDVAEPDEDEGVGEGGRGA